MEELDERLAVLVEAGAGEVVVAGALDLDEPLGPVGGVVEALAHLEGHDRIARAVGHQHGHLHVADLGERVELLREDEAHREETPGRLVDHVAHRGEGRLQHEAGLVGGGEREPGGDGPAEGVSDDETLATGSELGEVIPGRLGVLVGVVLGGHQVRAPAEAAVVHGEHRKAELAPAFDASHAAGQIPARAVQVEDDGGVGIFGREPPCVQLLRAAGHRHPMLVEWVAGAVETPPFILGGTEDQVALLFGEEGTAADHRGGKYEREPLQDVLVCPKGTGKTGWRMSVSLCTTIQAANNTTTIAATTSKAGLLMIFQIVFCQSLERIGCIWRSRCRFRLRGRRGVPAAAGIEIRACDAISMPQTRELAFRCTRAREEHAHAHFAEASGSERTRFPASAKSALATAGATGGVPGSPTPVGFSPPGTRCTSTTGISFMRSTR